MIRKISQIFRRKTFAKMRKKIRSRVKLLRFLEQRLQSGAKGLQSGAVQ